MDVVLGDLSDVIRKWNERLFLTPTLGSFGFLASKSALSRFISARQVAVRPFVLISSSTPLSHSLSLLKAGSAREVVVDRR